MQDSVVDVKTRLKAIKVGVKEGNTFRNLFAHEQSHGNQFSMRSHKNIDMNYTAVLVLAFSRRLPDFQICRP